MAVNPSAMPREIEIIIGEDGTVSIDQIGWQGKACDGAVDDLIKMLGKEVKSERKQDWYKEQKVRINQRHR